MDVKNVARKDYDYTNRPFLPLMTFGKSCVDATVAITNSIFSTKQ
jgi:hypothetical protein